MRIPCVYIIVSIKCPDRFYIGSTIDFNQRKSKHLSMLRNRRHYNRFLQNHADKHGLEDLNISLIEELTSSEGILQREQFYIDLFNPQFNGTKIATGTGNKSNTGKKLKPESIEKMRQALIGRALTPEWKAKIGATKIGKKRPDWVIAKLRKPKSDEHKRKLSEARKGKPSVARRQRVIDTESGTIYSSLKEAAKNTGILYGTLVSMLNGRSRNKTSLLHYNKPQMQ